MDDFIGYCPRCGYELDLEFSLRSGYYPDFFCPECEWLGDRSSLLKSRSDRDKAIDSYVSDALAQADFTLWDMMAGKLNS